MTLFQNLTWKEAGERLARGLVVILPVGSTEAHGPHLPLSADVIIAEEIAARAARKLESRGESALTLPPLAYSVTDFSEGFAGSVSIRAETATALVGDILLSLIKQDFKRIAIANAHLDPAHLEALGAGSAKELPEPPMVEAAPRPMTKLAARKAADNEDAA